MMRSLRLGCQSGCEHRVYVSGSFRALAFMTHIHHVVCNRLLAGPFRTLLVSIVHQV